MKTWDILLVGGGVIGLSLAWELRKNGATVLVLERGELGGEASCAAGGMLAWCDPHLPEATRGLALLSAGCYAEFVKEIEQASGTTVDLRRIGTIVVDEGTPTAFGSDCRTLSASDLEEIEPGLRSGSRSTQWWPEWSVDPRRLMSGLTASCRLRGVELRTGAAVTEVVIERQRAAGVRSTQGEFRADKVVNCAGAWAGEILCEVEPSPSSTRPVKGQMLALEAQGLRHVVRSPEVYLIPRSDGTVVVGATVEEAGFDKATQPEVIERLRVAAVAVFPQFANSRVRETWAGLRPASADGLPILGETSLSGYFIATGHFRDGILLAPGTARIMAKLVSGEPVSSEFLPLSPKRFAAAFP